MWAIRMCGLQDKCRLYYMSGLFAHYHNAINWAVEYSVTSQIRLWNENTIYYWCSFSLSNKLSQSPFDCSATIRFLTPLSEHSLLLSLWSFDFCNFVKMIVSSPCYSLWMPASFSLFSSIFSNHCKIYLSTNFYSSHVGVLKSALMLRSRIVEFCKKKKWCQMCVCKIVYSTVHVPLSPSHVDTHTLDATNRRTHLIIYELRESKR